MCAVLLVLLSLLLPNRKCKFPLNASVIVALIVGNWTFSCCWTTSHLQNTWCSNLSRRIKMEFRLKWSWYLSGTQLAHSANAFYINYCRTNTRVLSNRRNLSFIVSHFANEQSSVRQFDCWSGAWKKRELQSYSFTLVFISSQVRQVSVFEAQIELSVEY